MGYIVGKGKNPETSIQEITGLDLSTHNSADADPANKEDKLDDVPVMANTGQLPVPSDSQPEIVPFVRPEGNETAAWNNAEIKSEQPKTISKPQVRQSQPVAKSANRYDFRFQTAAFKSTKDAEQLKSRLAKAGINARTEKNGKVILVIASLRGTDSDAAAFKQKLRSLKLGNPLQLSKKAVGAKGKK